MSLRHSIFVEGREWLPSGSVYWVFAKKVDLLSDCLCWVDLHLTVQLSHSRLHFLRMLLLRPCIDWCWRTTVVWCMLESRATLATIKSVATWTVCNSLLKFCTTFTEWFFNVFTATVCTVYLFIYARGWCQPPWLGFGCSWQAISLKNTSSNRRQYYVFWATPEIFRVVRVSFVILKMSKWAENTRFPLTSDQVWDIKLAVLFVLAWSSCAKKKGVSEFQFSNRRLLETFENSFFLLSQSCLQINSFECH